MNDEQSKFPVKRRYPTLEAQSIRKGNARDDGRKRKENRGTCMVTGIEVLGYDGVADIIDVAYWLESGTGRFMRLWCYLEDLESISQSGVRLEGSISATCKGHVEPNPLEMRCLL